MQLKDKPGTIHPSEYDWVAQFNEIDPSLGFISLDAGKVYGLAIYVQELESQLFGAPLAAKTSVIGVDQSQRDVPAVEIPQVVIETVEEESRGRKSKLGIPYKSGSKEYARAYYARNREKMNERTKKWQQENKEKVQATQQSYREATKEELREAATPKSPRQRFEDVFGDNNDTTENTNG